MATFQYRYRAHVTPASSRKKVPYRAISVTKLSPHIGAEIGNVDLTRPLSDVIVRDLKAAFTEFQVLFFRDQKISNDDQARFARHFGSLGKHVGQVTNSVQTDNPAVRKFHYDAHSPHISGENFHSDQSCAPIPPLGSMLYNHTIPPDGGGDTEFASMYAAYDALSPRMKIYLKGLTAKHDGTRVFGPGSPIADHPVVVQHPASGRKALYVNTDFTIYINELPKFEGDRLLALLIDHCVNPQWTCRFHWTPHSIAFWDNRCVQHRAIWDYWPNTRSGYRVQIDGTAAPIPGSIKA